MKSNQITDSACAEQAAQASRLDLFWSTLTPALDNMPQDSKLHNVAQLSYTVQDLLPSLHPHDPEAVVRFIFSLFSHRKHYHILVTTLSVLYYVWLTSVCPAAVGYPNL